MKTFIELGGAVAVLIGLIFVGLELRQNTAAIQASTFQDMTHASSEFLVTVVSDPELRRVFTSGGSNLSVEDRAIFALLQQSLWLRMQNAFRQWQIGTLTDEDWSVYYNISCGWADNPAARAHWQNQRALTDSFKKMLEECDE